MICGPNSTFIRLPRRCAKIRGWSIFESNTISFCQNRPVFFPNQTFAIQPSSKSDSACQTHELQPHPHASPEGNHAKRLDRFQSHHAISISLIFESTFAASLATPEANKSNKSSSWIISCLHSSKRVGVHFFSCKYLRDAISSTSMPLSRTAVPMPTPNNGISNKTLDVHALPR